MLARRTQAADRDSPSLHRARRAPSSLFTAGKRPPQEAFR
ncbi:Hypothetical protein CAP_3439 [Chondromyces apiculatus DSM 436]|uniref:Uncharacterized protein n=1 Tax=Chondromyces apiculatus DSM 436 TaxID=1192034 RepID=A0A017T7P9_9BACT|nr:Hypothetical protein CAP_3439 [Chondromyces apiculatus DSM 436]